VANSKTSPIEGKLRQAWRQQRRYHHVRGLSQFLIWLVFMIALDFVIDWGIFFQVRMTMRLGFVLLGINVAVLGWVLWREWLRHLKPFDPLLVSLEVESKHPELTSLLVSYTQLGGEGQADEGMSTELIEAMRDEAVIQTQRVDFREIVNFAQLRNLLAVAGCVLLLFGVFGSLNQPHLQALIKRLAGIDATYPTKTQITGVSDHLTVRVGDSASVWATVEGVIPESGQVYTRPSDGSGSWKALPLRKGNNLAFERELREVVKKLDYYVRVGDDQSAEYRISVVPAPQIVASRVTLTYPEYMDREVGQSDELNLEVPQGTKIHCELTCDTSIKSLLVKTNRKSSDKDAKGEVITAKVLGSGMKVTFDLIADKGFKYTFLWTENESGEDFEYGDVQFNVRVIPDAIPEVELRRPAVNGHATVQKTVNIVGIAGDDHGLSEAWLVYTLDGSEQKPIKIHDFKGALKKEFTYAWELKKTVEGLKPGSVITLAVEVTDRSPEAKRHRRRSATREFKIVERETYLQWQRVQLAAQRDEILRVRDSEKTSSTKVKQLKKQEAKTP
jgi:hypothetical protein